MAADRSPTLTRVLAGQLCSGCGACAGISDGAIRMTVDGAGYSRPRQDRVVSDAVESAIAASCPGVSPQSWPDGEDVHPYWGPHARVMTGHAGDPELRHHASSGGALSALLVHALESGQVDAVLHVRADPANPTQNITTLSRSRDEIFAGAGSRYAPSSPLEAIETILAGPDRIAFVGKPCDVSALRRLGAIDPRVAQKVPLMLSFFCGGVPSRAGARAILDRLGIAEADVTRFNYRGDGWPGMTVAIGQDGSRREMTYAESWGSHLSPTVQFRCKICPDAVGGAADIVCADAWHCDDRGYPLFTEEEGQSWVIARTAAGAAFVDGAIERGMIQVQDRSIENIDPTQPGQSKRKRLLLSRLSALWLLLRPVYKARGLRIGAAARRAGFGEAIRSFGGMIRRAMKRP